MRTIYKTDAYGVFLYAAEASCLPFGAIEVPPPDFDSTAQIARWVSDLAQVEADYGYAETGRWVIEVDLRAVPLYRTTDGSVYQIGSDADGVEYHGGGAMPDWLTKQARPDSFHTWEGGEWVLDVAAQAVAQSAQERSWRDGEIDRLAWLRERHRDEIDAGMQTTLPKEQYAELLAYIQKLRDWPDNLDFPDPSRRPTLLDWI